MAAPAASNEPIFDDITSAVRQTRYPAVVFEDDKGARHARALHMPPGSMAGGAFDRLMAEAGGASFPVALLPPIYPEWLGAGRFNEAHGCRFPYVVGEMARGIATARMVIAAVKSGLFAFFGSAGLRPGTIGEAIDEITAQVGADAPWGANLIHSPQHVEREGAIVDLFLQRGVRNVSASAFMKLSPELVRYSAHGLSRRPDGEVHRATNVFAKISRQEVAARFLEPPEASLLRELAAAGRITEEQAELHNRLPVAEDITVEADSGGHTDNRPLTAQFPLIAALRHTISEDQGYVRSIRLGAAGGLGTPDGVAAAFQLGADYVLTGSINQSAIESGLAEPGRLLLAACGPTDIAMAPAADMFEMGVKVQVLKRGTMFALRGQRIYELYRRYQSFDELPDSDRDWLERQVLLETCEEAWQQARAHCMKSNPERAQKADADPRLRMALVFRRYLFMGNQWARDGHTDRTLDYQIWCGPAMGAFNDWVKGSFLEEPGARTVDQIALNLLEGAAAITRAQQLRSAGVTVPEHLFAFRPRPLTLA